MPICKDLCYLYGIDEGINHLHQLGLGHTDSNTDKVISWWAVTVMVDSGSSF